MSDCGLVGHVAGIEITSGFDKLWALARDLISQMEQNAEDLGNLIEGLQPTDIDLKTSQAELPEKFQKPGFGGVGDVGVSKPVVPNVPNIPNVSFTETAEKPGEAPQSPGPITIPDTPDPLDVAMPGPAPSVGDYDFPDAPSDEIPPAPQFLPISIPRFEAITLPEVKIPDIGFAPDHGIGSFEWDEPRYEPMVRQEVADQIRAILGGSTGIPDKIWDMIWARARRQAQNAGRAAKEEILDSWASRGHFLTNGAMRRRMDLAALQERDAVVELTREQVIQDAKIYVERLNNALVQGIALEQHLVDLYNVVAARSLDVAKTRLSLAIDIANYKLSVYNANITKLELQLRLYEQQIRAELSKLEKTRAELEAQKLIGELNMQELEKYKAQIGAVTAKYELFARQVQAVTEKYNADRTRVEAFAAEVEAYRSLWQAKEVEWKGFSEQVRAELSKQEVYKIAADIFSSRVQAYATGIQADRARLEGEIAAAKNQLEVYASQLESVKAEIQAEELRVRSQLQLEELKLKEFETKAGVEGSRISGDIQRTRAELDNMRVNLEAQANEIRLAISDAEFKLRAQQSALEAMMKTNASIGSAALAALNYSANVSESASNSTSCTTQYYYEMASK